MGANHVEHQDCTCEWCLNQAAFAARNAKPQPVEDVVSRPAHYTRGGVECLDAIEAWGLGFHLGNALKYIARCGHKAGTDPIVDLKKARFYLDREIKRRGG